MMHAKLLLLTAICVMFGLTLGRAFSQEIATSHVPFWIASWSAGADDKKQSAIELYLRHFPTASCFCLFRVPAGTANEYVSKANGVGLARVDVRTESRTPLEFKSVEGSTGGDTHSLVLYDPASVELLNSQELIEQEGITLCDGNHPAPLICLFRHVATGKEFYLIQSDLALDHLPLQKKQDKALHAWIEHNRIANGVIVVGDVDSGTNKHVDLEDKFPSERSPEYTLTRVEPNGKCQANTDALKSQTYGTFVGGRAVNWSPKCEMATWPSSFQTGNGFRFQPMITMFYSSKTTVVEN